MKVNELAKELKKTPKELIKFLAECDIKVKSGNTKLTQETAETVRELFFGTKPDKKSNDDSSESKVVHFTTRSFTVKEFVDRIKANISDIMRVILQKGLSLNLNSIIDSQTALEIAQELGIELMFDDPVVSSSEESKLKTQLDQIAENEIEADIDKLQTRPPVITIMGHVDHGKTLLLDTIRNANAISKEAGGITQHIGAYQITKNGHRLTFLDTPGHEAFTSIRSRGTQVTDIVILVVAADDGVKPQTVEAISHAKAAKIPIIVAINKIDKPEANIEQCKQQLSTHDLVAEDWGGDIVMVPISAKENKGIDQLLEMILLVAEMADLQADPTCLAKGVIIESQLSKQRGPIATVLIKSGTLRVGDNFLIGNQISGKVRALINDSGKSIHAISPGDPAELLGISSVPDPGELLTAFPSEKDAKQQLEKLQSQLSSKQVKSVSMETLSKQIEEGSIKQLPLIIKADVTGSLEAIVASINQIPTEEVSIHIIHTGTGPITESDILLAKASSSLVLSFGVPIPSSIKKMADDNNITIKGYNIIYNILNDIKSVIEGMFTTEYEEVETATIDVRELFSFSKVGTIAGCYVKSGKIERQHQVRIMRDKKIIFDGPLQSLKRFKEDVKEVATGFECGIVINGFDDLQVGDSLIGYTLKEKVKSL